MLARVVGTVEKRYDPDQPRDPKGTDTGGQWTAAGGTAQATGERVEVQYDEFVEGDAKRAMDAFGISEAEVRAMLDLPGYRGQIIISTSKDVSLDMAFTAQVTWTDDAGDQIGECSRYFSVNDGDMSCYNDNLVFTADFQDHGLARSLYTRQIEILTNGTNVKKVRMIADVSIGRYAWAKMGFQYKVPQLAREASQQFKSWAAEKNIDLSSVGWPEFKTSQDVANYKVPGVRLPSTRLSNPDIKPGDYEVGKAFMLDKDGHGSWSAVLWLKK